MSDRKSLLTNLLSQTTARVLMRVATAASALIIARYLGTERYGIYAAAFAFVSLGVVFTEPGLIQVIIRSGARGEDRLPKLFGNALVVKAVLLSTAYFVLLGLSRLIGHGPELQTTVAILGVGLLLLSGHQVAFALFASFERMHITAVFQVATAAIVLCGVAGIATRGGDLFQMASVQIAAGLLPLPVLLLVTWRQTAPRPEPSRIGTLLREGFPFALGNIFYFFNAQIDLVVMGAVLASSSVGLYAAANRLVAILYVLPSIVSWVIIPRLYRYGLADPRKHGAASGTVLRYLSLFGLVISVLLFIGAEPTIRLLFGAPYVESAPLLRILCWFLALQCIGFPLGDALTTAEHNNLRVTVSGIGAALNLGLNLWLIPLWGPIAAAYVRLGSEAFLLLGFALMVYRKLPQYPLLGALRSQALAVPLAFGAAWLFLGRSHAHTWSTAIPAGALFVAVTLGSVVLLGFLREPEKRFLRALFSRR